jgi:hypothetical protein
MFRIAARIPVRFMHRRAAPRALAPGALFAGAALALLAPALTPLAGTAQEVQLRYAFTEGAEHRYEMLQHTTVPIPGMGVMTQEQRQVLGMRVLSVDAEGNARIRQTIESVRMSMESPMGTQVFDSESSEVPDPAFAPLGALAGTGSEIVLSPDGTVVDFGDLDAWMETMLEGVDPEVRGMLGDAYSEEALESMVRQSFQALPPGSLRPGESWEYGISIPAAFGSIESTTVYTLRGVETVEGRSVAVFDVTGTLGQLVPEAGNPMAGMVEMRGGDMEGVFRFDLDRGLFLDSEVSTTMEMEIMGQSMSSTTRMQLRLLP